MNEVVIAIIMSSAVAGIVSHFLTRKKYHIDNETKEFELSEKITSFYKKELTEMIIKLDALKVQIESLEIQVENLSLDNCLEIDCPKRRTKRNKKWQSTYCQQHEIK